MTQMIPKQGLYADFVNKMRGWLRFLRSESSLGCLAWYVIIGTPLAMLFVVVPLFSELHTINTLKATGYSAKARVITSRIFQGSEDTAYYITYEFAALDDKHYIREQQIREQAYNAMSIGTTLEIVYDRSNPAVSRLSSFDDPDITEKIQGLGLCGFLGLLLIFLSLPFRKWVVWRAS